MEESNNKALKPLRVETLGSDFTSEPEKGHPDNQLEHMDTYIAAEHAGTIFEHEGDSGRLTLHPMPSLDPNDPLNWPRSKKYMTYLTICFFSFLGTVNTSKFSVAVVVIGKEFHTTSTTTGFLLSFGVLMLGLGNLFWVVMLRILGRRPVFLLAIPLIFATNLWAYYAKSFGSLLASSIVGGFAAAAAEAPVSAVVADLFFVNERGTMLMIFHLALSCGFFVGPFLNAYVVQYAGWRWICGWIAIASAVCWLVALFTIHETAYRDRDVEAPAEKFGPLRPYRSWLSVTKGYDLRVGFFRTTWNMLAVIGYPSVPWVGLVVGAFVGWNIVVQQEAARVFTVAPYYWKVHSLGLLSLSGLIGALFATFLGGKLIDIIANRMTKSNHGRREPEFRLPTIIFPGIIGPMGILIFGLCVAKKLSWGGAAVGYGMQGFGLTAASNILVTYAVDSYLPLAGEALVVVFVFRGISGCALSIFAPNWIKAAGTANAFGQMVAVQYFLLIFVVLFAFKGQQIRVMTARYGPLKHLTSSPT